jgi:hypothetical protein
MATLFKHGFNRQPYFNVIDLLSPLESETRLSKKVANASDWHL